MNTTILLSILAELPLKERLGDSNETVTLGELIVKITEAVFTLEMNGELGVWVFYTLIIGFFLILFLFYILPLLFLINLDGRQGSVCGFDDSEIIEALDDLARQNKKLEALKNPLEKPVDKDEPKIWTGVVK